MSKKRQENIQSNSYHGQKLRIERPNITSNLHSKTKNRYERVDSRKQSGQKSVFRTVFPTRLYPGESKDVN